MSPVHIPPKELALLQAPWCSLIPWVTSDVVTRSVGKPPFPPLFKGAVELWVGWRGSCPFPACLGSEGPSRALVTPAQPHPRAELVFPVQERLFQHSRGAVPKGLPHLCTSLWLSGLPHLAWDKGGHEGLALLQLDPQQTLLGEMPPLKLCFGFLLHQEP